MKYLESFWNHSKVDTDKLYKYLDLEIPNDIFGNSVDRVEVNVIKRNLSADYLQVILHTKENKVVFTYLTSGNTISRDFCKIQIGNSEWILRSNKGGMEGGFEEFVHHELMKIDNKFDEINEIDKLILKYFGLVKEPYHIDEEEEDEYEEEEEEEEEEED